MIKRIFDIVCSAGGIFALSPLLIWIAWRIKREDRGPVFYRGERVGLHGQIFHIYKFRTMVVNAEKLGGSSTSDDDPRITKIGRTLRKYKLDELPQLFNVLGGDMSLVGPRPNVKRETDLYTNTEEELVSVKPGITDFSSIVFSDEGDILKESKDPDIDYNRLIRPWKSRLSLLYIKHQSLWLYFSLILLTAVAIVSRRKALQGVHKLLVMIAAPEDVVRVAKRKDPLVPSPPPGSDSIVTARSTA